ncbi:hypothetical protein GOODEAATRI_018794, partial [Goodea atripinnis]
WRMIFLHTSHVRVSLSAAVNNQQTASLSLRYYWRLSVRTVGGVGRVGAVSSRKRGVVCTNGEKLRLAVLC